MKMRFSIAMVLATVALVSCNNGEQKENNKDTTASVPSYKEESVSYKADSIDANGMIVYDENDTTKKPGVLVVHEWWGLNDYAKKRAHQLAELGYVAMAVDMYGNGKTADNPEGAMALAGPFYQNPMLTKTRLEAAMQKLKENSHVDTTRIAAIGYCYGGFVVLNAAKLGADLKGVVVFHGNLSGAPVRKDLLKARILVCNGGADSLVPYKETAAFKKDMDAAGANYTYKAYEGALHAFTNPASTEAGQKFKIPVGYNEKADKQSWEDMKQFLGEVLK